MAKKDLLTAVAALAVVGVGGVAAYAYLSKKGPGGGGMTYAVSVLVLSPSGPFPGALVELGGQVSTTDQSGTASFAGVQGGSALLSVNATGYQLAQQSVNVGQFSTSFRVDLTQPQACTPQPCSCGQVWDPTLCKCSALIPAGILMSPSQSVNIPWKVSIDCLFQQMTAGAIPPGKSCFDTIPPTVSVFIMVKGTVVDTKGHPICGVPVNFSISQPSFTWDDGNVHGTFDLTGPGSDITDANGNFNIDLVFSVTLKGYNAWKCVPNLFALPPFSTTVPITFTLTAEVSGTLIEGIQVVSVSNQMCEFFS